MPRKTGNGKNWLQQLLEHERIVKEIDTRLFQLYMKARDKRKAAKIVAEAMRGKITYQEAMKRLRALTSA